MNILAIFCLITMTLTFASAQINGTCVHTKLITPAHFFETERVLGKWHGIELYSSLSVDAHPLMFKCLDVSYNRTSNPKELDALETFVNMETDETEEYPERVVIDSELPLEAIWKLYGQMTESDMVWLHTDYENWAIAFLCSVKDNYRYEAFTILSRSRSIDQKTLDILQVLAVGYGFPAVNGRLIDQTGCLNVQ